MHVLGTGFFAVVAVTKRLPVASVPKQNGIAVVRNNMVDIGCLRVLAQPQALFTERMRLQELGSGLPPRPSITTAGSGPDFLRVQRLMGRAVLGPGWHELRAARMPTRHFWLGRH